MNRILRTARLGSFAVCLLLPAAAFAQPGQQDRLTPARYRDGRDVKAAYKPVVKDASQSVVRILGGGKDVALGTVVGPDGWVVTKYSELRSPLVIRTREGKEYPAKVVGVAEPHDLAMLKADATGWKPVEWKTGDPGVGQLLATAGASDDPVAVGILSVARRKIPGQRGVLGVATNETPNGPQITRVYPGTAAEKIGLKVGDVVKRVADAVVADPVVLGDAIRVYKPGDPVKLQIIRGDQEMEVVATLTVPPPDGGPGSREVDQNTMGGPLSTRGFDFPVVFQHDTVLKPNECGGPLVELSGKVIGINIARGGRTESYAIPADVVQGMLVDLMSGKLASKSPLPGEGLKALAKIDPPAKTDAPKEAVPAPASGMGMEAAKPDAAKPGEMKP